MLKRCGTSNYEKEKKGVKIFTHGHQQENIHKKKTQLIQLPWCFRCMAHIRNRFLVDYEWSFSRFASRKRLAKRKMLLQRGEWKPRCSKRRQSQSRLKAACSPSWWHHRAHLREWLLTKGVFHVCVCVCRFILFREMVLEKCLREKEIKERKSKGV